jgi:type VI secretion system protein VasG
MPQIPRSALYGKLNSVGYKAFEGAATFAKLRGNPFVEFVHFFNCLFQQQDSDAHRIVKAFGTDAGKLVADMQAALERLPGRANSLDFSSSLFEAVNEGWSYATLKFGENSIRTGHVLLAALSNPNGAKSLAGISREFTKIDVDKLAEEFAKITDGSPEAVITAVDSKGVNVAPGEASGAMSPAAMGKEQAIKQFCDDLTEKARSGKMDPVLGRDEEIRQCIDVLMRRRQNNPMLTGEAGVGKTAVVEGFAQKIVNKDVPPQLQDVRLLELKLTSLQAGASMKGEFEQRLKQLVDEVQSSTKPIILFIDEAHMLIGAGGGAGAGDAANILKPALARGTLRTIGATTQAEYKQYFEKDPAMSRRFQVVKVDEPDEAKCLLMMRGLAKPMEKHYAVQVLDEAFEAAVRLGKRYIQGRQLPDKAVGLIDTASARVAVGLGSIPGSIDDSRKRIQALKAELELVDREIMIGADHTARKADIIENITKETEKLGKLESRFSAEKALVTDIIAMRGKLIGGVTAAPGAAPEKSPIARENRDAADAALASTTPQLSDAERADILSKLKVKTKELADIQGENPMLSPCVDASAVSAVVSDWTGIPLGKMVKNEIEGVLKLPDTLERRVIGQRHGLESIAKQIGLSRAKVSNPNRPVGVFMLVGPSGVGKTETAEALAEALYGGPQGLIRINMSEYQEAHKVSLLMGSPPGYVGYGKGGVMTEAVRRRPYSVLLLDEVEKAHADIHEIFFQVFDKGIMKDSEGVDIDFKNTIILLTSNVGTELVMKMCKDPTLKPDPEGLVKAMREPLLKVFPPALLGRLEIVPYYPISDEMMRAIIGLQLKRVGDRIRDGYKVPFTHDKEVEDLIVSRVTEIDSGARAIDAIISRQLLPSVGRELLGRMVSGAEIKKVHVSVKDSDFAYAFE